MPSDLARMRVYLAVVVVLSFLVPLTLVSDASAASETTGDTFPASITAGGEFADAPVGQLISISADGRLVAFESKSANLAGEPVAAMQTYVKDLGTGEVQVASRASGVAGAPAGEPTLGPCGPPYPQRPTISGSGRYVLFESNADNLVAGLPLEGEEEEECASFHVYRRDLETGETELVDRVSGIGGETVGREALADAISADGRYVLFSAEVEDLDEPDGEHEWGRRTVYLRDMQTGATTAVSRASGEEGALANRPSEGEFISADGRFATFSSWAGNLAPNIGSNTREQLYLRELQAPYATVLLSQSSAGEPGNELSALTASLGEDGCAFAFTSLATNLVPAAPFAGVYVRDRCASPPLTSLISLGPEGEPFEEAELVGTSDDGSVAFKGHLEAGPSHLYLRDHVGASLTLLDRAAGTAGEEADRPVSDGAIAANGCRAVFTTEATNLTAAAPPVGAPQQAYVRQIAPCKPSPPAEERHESTPPTGGTGDESVPAATKLGVTRRGPRLVRLWFDGAGRARIRLQRVVSVAGHRHRKLVKSLIVSADLAGSVWVKLPYLRPGHYLLQVRLQGDPGNRTMTRRIRVPATSPSDRRESRPRG